MHKIPTTPRNIILYLLLGIPVALLIGELFH
jgi:hypothetical protein